MKLSEIARHLGCQLTPGAEEKEILRISSIEQADEHSVTFVADKRFLEAASRCRAAAIIVKKGAVISGTVCFEVDDPYLGYAKIAQLFEDTAPLFDGPRHPSASIDPGATIHPTVFVGPGSVVGKGCALGERTIVGANCVIENNSTIGSFCRIDSGAIIRRNTQIGDRVIIQSGAVIGSEGFGNAMEAGKFVRIPCFGNVVIEDDVEIGAGTTIDRGNFQSTIIKAGARIDNLVQIAHNVEVGEDSAIAAQAGISGSTKVGRNVLIGGQAGFVGHIEIGDGSFVGAKAGVSKNVRPGGKITGYPARDFMQMRRIEAAQSDLPGMRREVMKLRAELNELKEKLKTQLR